MSGHPRISRFFRWLTFIVVLATGAQATAAHESFAVLSRIGDTISIVTYRPSVGSSLDTNGETQVTLGDGHFDDLAARAATDALRRADPEAAAHVLNLPDRATAADVSASRAGEAAPPALLEQVGPLLGGSAPHYLVVIGNSRGDAHLKTDRGFIGSGKLSGLGFYLDPYKRVRKSATGERGRGFIAPFAYLEVDLIDLTTGTVVRAQPAIESTTRANVGPDSDLNPWDALPADEKVRLLDRLVTRAVHIAVERVVTPE